MQDYSMLQAFKVLELLNPTRYWLGLSKKVFYDSVGQWATELPAFKVHDQKEFRHS